MTTSDSLINKYRPQSFEEVVGQDKAVKSIQSVCRTQSPNAFLLTGSSGTGKTTIARLIADELGVEPQSVLEVDAASYTGIDSMRSLIESLSYKSVMGSDYSKALIIDEVHALSKQAAQSMLKTLEEPPEGVVWILCTTDPDKLLKTIRTRCFEYDLQPVDADSLFDLLAYVADQEEFDVADEVLDEISERSEGSPRQALGYLSICKDMQSASEAAELLSGASEGDVSRLAYKLIKDKFDNWKEAAEEAKQAVAENGNNPESVRLGVVNYLGRSLVNEKSEVGAAHKLNVLEAFSEPYNPQEGIAPLMRSVGIVIMGSS